MQAFVASGKRTNRRTLFSEARQLSTEPLITRSFRPRDVRLINPQHVHSIVGFGDNKFLSSRDLEFIPGFCSYSPYSNTTLRKRAMTLAKPNQQMRRDLKDAAALLKWAGADLFVVSRRMMAAGDEQGAMELMRIAMSLQGTEDRLAGYADEVATGRVSSSTA